MQQYKKMIEVPYNVGGNTINYHLKKINCSGFDEKSVIRKFRITAYCLL